MLFGGRPKLSIGMITGKPASIDNQYVPGSGVGASSISARRLKSRLSRPPHKSNKGVANPPTNVRAEVVEGEIVISWTAPTYIGDSPIISYTITSSPGGNKITTRGTTGIFKDLLEDTAYTFMVITTNYGGNSISSDESNSVTMAVNATAPTNLSGTVSDSSVTITFTESEGIAGKEITNYEYSIDGGITYIQFDPSGITSPVIITGLTNGITYTINLRAITSYGSGVSGSIRVKPYTIPSIPVITSGESGDEQVILYFTQESTGGDTITNYQYSIDGTTYFYLSPMDITSPITIPGLINGTEYTIYLKAVNAAGEGATSDPITITPYTVPSAPTSLSSIIGDSEATISFTKVSDGGSTITKFQYSLDNGEYIDISGNSDTISLTITELINGTTYTISLRAVNAGGEGLATEIEGVKPYTTPGAPTISSATEGNGETILAFTAPISTGGSDITTYKYTLTGGTTDISGNTTTSPVTVTGLTNGTTYIVSLKAENTAGVGTSSNTISIIPYTTASAPTIGTITIGDGEATINFTAPFNGGRTITKYQYSINGVTTNTDISSSATSFTLTGLTNGISYTISVWAVTIAGLGASTTTTVTSYTTPGAPTDLTIGSVGSAYVDISFNAPSNIGGTAITNYQYSITGGAFTGTYTVSSPVDITSPVRISGLTNGTTYIVTLKAMNAQGAGTASDPITVMSYTTPAAPLSLSVKAGSGEATITFSAGSDGGKPITNYLYSTDGTNYTSLSDSLSPVTITGLTNGTTYTIRLKAVNEVGAGTATDPVTVTPIQYLTAGSLLFDSTNEYLKLSPGIALGSGAYTVECWFYNNNRWSSNDADQPYQGLMGCVVNSETGGMNLEFTNSKTVLIDRNGNGDRYTYTFASSISLNEWHHFVLVRNSSFIETIFIDGIKAISASGGTNASGGQQTNTLAYPGKSDVIGKTYEAQWYGYLSNFRAVAGTAVYDPTAASMTVPTAVLTSITNTQYLMLGDSATSDAAGLQTITMNGTVTQTTAYKPF